MVQELELEVGKGVHAQRSNKAQENKSCETASPKENIDSRQLSLKNRTENWVRKFGLAP
jgi:hypothetical protein